jgi:hypothetical protein
MSRARFALPGATALAALALGTVLWLGQPSRAGRPTAPPSMGEIMLEERARAELALTAMGNGAADLPEARRARVGESAEPAGRVVSEEQVGPAGPDLEGRLLCLDARTRAPLEGVLVEVEGLDAAGAFATGATRWVKSDAGGVAALRLFSWCEVSARISRPGYLPETVELAWKPAPAPPELELLLAPSARLLGQVTGAEGAPLDRLRVEVEIAHRAPDAPDTGRASGERSWTFGPLTDGRYALDVPAGVDLDLLVTSAGQRILYEPSGVRLAPGEVLVRDFHLQPGGTLRGVRLDAAG